MALNDTQPTKDKDKNSLWGADQANNKNVLPKEVSNSMLFRHECDSKFGPTSNNQN